MRKKLTYLEINSLNYFVSTYNLTEDEPFGEEKIAFVKKGIVTNLRISEYPGCIAVQLSFGEVRNVYKAKVPMGANGLVVAKSTIIYEKLYWKISLFAPKSRTVVFQNGKQEEIVSCEDVIIHLLMFENILLESKGDYMDTFIQRNCWSLAKKGW